MMKLFSVAIFASLFFASHQQLAGVHDIPAPKGCWTDWLNRDTTIGAGGDWETLFSLNRAFPGKICKTPRAIEAQTLTGLSWAAAGDVIFRSDPRTGFICRDRDQENEKPCSDYRVRFSCPLPYCKECWTQWFDRDDQFETGDWETLPRLLQENPLKICPSPEAIEAQTLTGFSAAAAGDVIYINDTTRGFVCRNKDQKEKKLCNDYRVRFRCPLSFCEVKVCWTQWFDGDDPSGSGDFETLSSLYKEYLGMICPKPEAIQVETLTGLSAAETGDVIYKNDTTTGFICRHSDQEKNDCNDYRVRFTCPDPYCEDKVCWTEWFNRDNPLLSGDWEHLRSLRKEYPGEICEDPLYIEAVTTDTNIPATSTGDIISLFSPTKGFVCRNRHQVSGQCHNYKVRFWCPC